jgi:O-antigen biosynthesis protein WbqP
MKRNTPNVATHLLNNPRSYLLKSGEKMRKLSIDELPNLINILKGEMVFIGPRPALYNQYDLLELRNKYGIDKLKPGITGWAQINGRDEISIEEKVQFEKEYFQKRSLLLDLKIIFWTISKVFKSNEVSH